MTLTQCSGTAPGRRAFVLRVLYESMLQLIKPSLRYRDPLLHPVLPSPAALGRPVTSVLATERCFTPTVRLSSALAAIQICRHRLMA